MEEEDPCISIPLPKPHPAEKLAKKVLFQYKCLVQSVHTFNMQRIYALWKIVLLIALPLCLVYCMQHCTHDEDRRGPT